MADAIEANLGEKPTQLSADAGYCSDANLTAMEEREIDAYIAPGRASAPGKEKAAAPASPPCAKIKAGGHSSPYRFRKQLPEPVFGRIKRRAASVGFSCAASRRSPTSGASSASPTIS